MSGKANEFSSYLFWNLLKKFQLTKIKNNVQNEASNYENHILKLYAFNCSSMMYSIRSLEF